MFESVVPIEADLMVIFSAEELVPKFRESTNEKSTSPVDASPSKVPNDIMFG